jgi:hypothetical protein
LDGSRSVEIGLGYDIGLKAGLSGPAVSFGHADLYYGYVNGICVPNNDKGKNILLSLLLGVVTPAIAFQVPQNPLALLPVMWVLAAAIHYKNDIKPFTPQCSRAARYIGGTITKRDYLNVFADIEMMEVGMQYTERSHSMFYQGKGPKGLRDLRRTLVDLGKGLFFQR